jgi:hypothetical protein
MIVLDKLYNVPLYEVNIESCQPGGGCFIRGKTTSRRLTIACSPRMKAKTVLLYRNYSKLLKATIFLV